MQQYHDLLKTILDFGSYKEAAREGMPGSLSRFGHQSRYDLTDGFPIVTTKKMYWKGIVAELLWFLRGDTNIKYLDEHNVTKMWHEDAYNYYVKLCPQFGVAPCSFDEFNARVKTGEKLGCYVYGDCGEQYGIQWRNFNKRPDYIVQPKPKCQTSSSIPKLGIADGSGTSELSALFDELSQTVGYKVIYRLHTTWEQMIERCYNHEASGYKSYGFRGVHVSNEWLTFKNFAMDVQELEGWDKKLNDWDNIQLDKDSSGHGFLYSKETCRWISRSDNMSSFDKVVVLERDGELIQTQNIRAYAKSIGVDHANLVRLVNGDRESAYGHKFVAQYDLNKGVDQIAEVIKSLRSSPYGRRHLVTSWNPNSLENLALHPCHALFQFNCRKISHAHRVAMYLQTPRQENDILHTNEEGQKRMLRNDNVPEYYLDCQLYQRSCDVLLGVPFNISSYCLLTYVIAKVVNMVPGEFIHTYGDVHIYDNHMDAVKEQLERDPLKYKLPKLELGGDWSKTPNADFSDLKVEDFKLVGYESYPKLESDTTLSTGMKK